MSDTLRPHRGTMILVFGIIGLVMCLPLGIAAWVMGHGDLKAMDQGQLDPAGRSMTQAGKVLGIVSVALGAAAIVVSVLFFAGALMIAGGHAAASH